MKVWIARDTDIVIKKEQIDTGSLKIFINKPKLVEDPLHNFWTATGEYGYLPKSLFPEITYDNSPQEIELSYKKL